MYVKKWITGVICLLVLAAIQVIAQNPRPITTGYPTRPPGDPAVVERGRLLYETSCAFCHGADARGAEDGSNLLRSELLLNDQNGELIAPILQNGVGEMPKFDLTDQQIADLAAFIHSFPVAGYDISRQRPATIVVGDAKAGEAYFQAKCGACHSVEGDLKGLAARLRNPRTMQQTWLMPGARGAAPSKPPVTTVTITAASGEKVTGRLVRIDDFIVTIMGPDDAQRTFRRDGASPKVEMHDPMQSHRDLLRAYTDKDIHNVTAYLESLR